MRTKGKYFWKAIWFSICSKHRYYEADCALCNAGQWRNVLVHKISSFTFKHCPNFWVWWMNCYIMRNFGKTSKFLRSTFPNLK
jgi:hypothetical protein